MWHISFTLTFVLIFQPFLSSIEELKFFCLSNLFNSWSKRLQTELCPSFTQIQAAWNQDLKFRIRDIWFRSSIGEDNLIEIFRIGVSGQPFPADLASRLLAVCTQRVRALFEHHEEVHRLTHAQYSQIWRSSHFQTIGIFWAKAETMTRLQDQLINWSGFEPNDLLQVPQLERYMI